MSSVIVLFPKLEEAKNIKNLLMRNGFKVDGVCASGAQALTLAEDLQGGVLVSGYRCGDMIYRELLEDLPKNFEMLLVASPKYLEDVEPGLVSLAMPLKLNELISTLTMMLAAQQRRRKRMKVQPVKRSGEDRALVDQAKAVLMERNRLSEADAHRYLQKCSMDSGTSMVESAQMVLRLMQQED
jgi:response regulator NasT